MKEKILFLFNVILLILMVLALSACSLKPTYESKSDIKKIVKANYGKDYKLVDTKSYEDDTEEKNLMYEYVFENDDNFSFSMYSYTRHTTFDASESIFYSSMVSDNYIEKKIENNYNEIDNILKSTNLIYKIHSSNINFDLYSFSDIDKLSKALYDVLTLLELDQNNNTDKEYYTISDKVYVSVNLYSGSEKAYGSTHLKHGVLESDIKEDLEKGLMNYIAQGNDFDKFDIPEDKWNNFKVKQATYEYKKNKHITFYYDEDLDDYYTTSLSICLNYDKYDYNHNDALQYIVESKGGTFSRSGWTNKWQIGNNTWKATMSVDSKDNFKSLEVTKNGKKLDLQYSNRGENNIFHQFFTRKTIEELLDVTVVINNDGTAYIY